MDIEQLKKDILGGRDLSKPEHEDLISQKVKDLIIHFSKNETELISAVKEFIKKESSNIEQLKIALSSEENYLDAKQIAKIIGVSVQTINQWRRNRTLLEGILIKPKGKDKASRHWREGDIIDWIKNNNVAIDQAKQAASKVEAANKKTEDEDIEEFSKDFTEKLMQET